MDGLSVLLEVGSGFLIASLTVWLLLRGQLEGAQRRAREEAEGLRAQLSGRETELAGLREELRREVELRAKAEEKAAQIGQLEQRLAELSQQFAALQEDNAVLRENASRLEASLSEERRQSEEKLRLLEDARGQLTVQFKQLANEILEDKSKRFTDQNKLNLDGVLSPLKEQIKDFEKKVHEVYDKETRDRVSLFNEISRLKELNQKMSADAVNLTRALKGESKTRGIWGEMILEQVLEKSGLTKDREYRVQPSLTTEDGRRLQPDVIVDLPEGKQIIIDSKVSLAAYERFCNAEDEAAQLVAIKEHCVSLRTHVKELSDKNYQNLKLRTLDYVLLFVPIEPAYYEAAREEPSLFGEALEKNIVIVTPSTLLATLRTIQNIWRFEYQNRYATEIAERAGRLYDKFVGFVTDLEDIGKRLGSTQRSYEEAMKKLSTGTGNLIKRSEDIKALGAKASKSLPAELVERASESVRALEVAAEGE